MDSPVDRSASPGTGRTQYSVVTERTTVRRAAGRRWRVAALVVPAAMTAFVGTTQAAALQDSLREDVQRTLSARGIAAADVVVEGRAVAIDMAAGTDPGTALEVAMGVPGVMSATATTVFSTAKEARACERVVGKVDKATHRQRIPFSAGTTELTGVGDQRARAAARALNRCPAATAIVGGHTDSSAPDAGRLSLERARVLIDVLVDAGVQRARLQPRGYGDQFEVADGTGAAERAANERGSVVAEAP